MRRTWLPALWLDCCAGKWTNDGGADYHRARAWRSVPQLMLCTVDSAAKTNTSRKTKSTIRDHTFKSLKLTLCSCDSFWFVAFFCFFSFGKPFFWVFVYFISGYILDHFLRLKCHRSCFAGFFCERRISQWLIDPTICRQRCAPCGHSVPACMCFTSSNSWVKSFSQEVFFSDFVLSSFVLCFHCRKAGNEGASGQTGFSFPIWKKRNPFHPCLKTKTGLAMVGTWDVQDFISIRLFFLKSESTQIPGYSVHWKGNWGNFFQRKMIDQITLVPNLWLFRTKGTTAPVVHPPSYMLYVSKQWSHIEDDRTRHNRLGKMFQVYKFTCL